VSRSTPALSPQDLARAYAQFWPPIRAKCRRLLASAEAEDVTQETFVRLWQWRERPALGSPDAARTVLAWLYRTSTRLAIDTLRARAWHGSGTDALASVPCGIDLDAALAAKTAIRDIGRAATDEELEAVILSRIDGLSQPEIAGVLGISERTVRRVLQRFDERTSPIRKEFEP
jgi:RNA polymerase sigma-70 factor, ECF subfamily